MKLKFFTFSFVMLFAVFSFAHTIHTVREPHKRMSEIIKILEGKDEDLDY